MRTAPAFACTLILLLAGCMTRPLPQWEWRVSNGDGQTALTYGRRNSARADFAVLCDTEAGVADLVYNVGAASGFVEGARTELLVAVDEDSIDNLPAEVGLAKGGELAVIARTVVPPTPVGGWIGKQLVIGVAGRATMLNVPPKRQTIEAFLKACRR